MEHAAIHGASSIIYIPLCIYFNLLHCISDAVDRNLHSTMYLFQPVFLCSALHRAQIYIPLCIYFNVNEILCCGLVNSIYIPLCIYFNGQSDTNNSINPTFTFHYVSISTLLTILLNLINSIYIPLCIYFNKFPKYRLPYDIQIYIPLCIYFNQLPNSTVIIRINIYIPLCIYFNQPRGVLPRPYFQFTFHYVSISTTQFRPLKNPLK